MYFQVYHCSGRVQQEVEDRLEYNGIFPSSYITRMCNSSFGVSAANVGPAVSEKVQLKRVPEV